MSLNLDKSGWPRVRFGDVVRNTNDTVRDPKSAGIDRVIAMEHMDPEELVIDRWGSLEDGTSFSRRVKPGQTLFGKRRAYQRKAAFAEFAAICSGDILTFQTDPSQMIPEFLPFLVSSDAFFNHALGTSAGSLSPRTNWRDLAKFEFYLPPLDDQQRIADLLWAAERHRRNLVAESLAIHSTSRILSSQILNEYPWEARLGDVLVDITAGRSFPGKSTPVSGPNTYGVLRVSAVSANNFVATENKELIRQNDFLAQYALRKGDLLITRANTSAYVGRPAIVDEDYDNLMLSDKTLRLNPDPAQTSVNFLREYLITPRAREAITAAATGTGAAMKNISQKDIRTLPMPQMSLTQQTDFLIEIDHMRAAQQDVDAESSTLRTLQQALLANVLGVN